MKILVAYDAGGPSRKALDTAVSMGKSFGAEIHILHSLSALDDSSETFEFIKADSSKIIKAREQAEEIVAEAREVVEKAGLPLETHLINRGAARGEDIVDIAKEINADIIAIGVHTKSKVGKVLFGSTAQYVILRAHCTVVTEK